MHDKVKFVRTTSEKLRVINASMEGAGSRGEGTHALCETVYSLNGFSHTDVF